MVKEFAALDKLASLEADAQKAASLIEEAGQGGHPSARPKGAALTKTTVRPSPELKKANPSTKTVEVVRTRQVSTMLRIDTHRRVMRAANLQAAEELSPDSLWAILDAAANRWCDENGF